MWIETAVNKIHKYQILPEHWVHEAGNFLEGIALGWYNSWLNAPGENTWQKFVDAMYHCFRRFHSALSIAWMWDSLKQEDLVEEYIKAQKKIQQLADSQVLAN